MARAVCGVMHVTIAALFCSSSLLCISNSDWATENETGRSVSVNGNEEPAGEICHQYSSVVTAIIPYLRTIKLQYTLLGDYWENVRPTRLPVLTWVPSSVPPGNNIKDTFLIGSATDTTCYACYQPKCCAAKWLIHHFLRSVLRVTAECKTEFLSFWELTMLQWVIGFRNLDAECYPELKGPWGPCRGFIDPFAQ